MGLACPAHAGLKKAAIAVCGIALLSERAEANARQRTALLDRIASAEELDRAVDRSAQEIIGFSLLVLDRNDLTSRRNGRHEIAQMPMTERWQPRQRRRIGLGIDRYIEIGLVVTKCPRTPSPKARPMARPA